MALRKFLKIENVGRFVNATQKGPELNRYNLIFAENGRGKTTLCAVLRSLATGRRAPIDERKTLGHAKAGASAHPNVAIRLDDSTVSFGPKGWNATVPGIAIFDATFIAHNVHAGEYVSREHRTNLLQVIVGEAGVKLAARVNELDAAIRDKNGKIAQSRQTIEDRLPQDIKLEAFLALPAGVNIEQTIVAKSLDLAAAGRAAEIKARSALSQLTIPELPEALQGILAKTLAHVSADAEQRVRQQIERHEMHENGEAWLSEGLQYIREDRCPFCAQSVKDLTVIKAYQQFFSDAYAALCGEIETLRERIAVNLGDTRLAQLGHLHAANQAGVEFWKQFAPISLAEFDPQIAVTTPVVALRTAALMLIERKLSSPLAAVAEDAALRGAMQTCEKMAQALDAYNASVKAANAAIQNKKDETQAANIFLIEQQLASLHLSRLRHDSKFQPHCAAYVNAVADKRALDKEKASAKAALDQHADMMIKDYENTINELLKGFGAGFSLVNSKKNYLGGTPASTYQILINGQPVELGDGDTPPGQHCFRTTLSAGDKSTLGLAFFLAQLDHDPQKADCIVVFDDPFNSQDRSRRERTAELLKNHGKQCQQLFLLSHDPFFLNLVYAKLPKPERHVTQLSRAADNATTIEEWDIEKETQQGYFKDHAALSSYVLNGAKDLIDIARKIRPILEGYLRYRFPHQFPDNDWLGDMIKRIRDAGPAHAMHPALAELEGINDYSKKYHHDTNPGKADGEPLNDGELRTFADRTLTITGGY